MAICMICLSDGNIVWMQQRVSCQIFIPKLITLQAAAYKIQVGNISEHTFGLLQFIRINIKPVTSALVSLAIRDDSSHYTAHFRILLNIFYY
jgi:hypothetical protein